MALEKFNLEKLLGLDDGRIRVAFDHALERLHADIIDRPADKKERRLGLVVNLVPVIDGVGKLTSISARFDLQERIPSRKSAVYDMLSTREGLQFNELSPDDAHQLTLSMADGPHALPPTERESEQPTKLKKAKGG